MAHNKQHFIIEASDNPLKFDVKNDNGVIIADVSLTSNTSFILTSFIDMSPEVLSTIREMCRKKFL